MAGVVARVAACPGAEIPDAAEQFVGIQAGADVAGRCGSLKELPAHGDQAVDEVGVQRLEGGVIGSQHFGQAVLGDQEVDEYADPADQRTVRPVAVRQQDRAGFGAGLDLVPVDGDDQVGSVGKCR